MTTHPRYHTVEEADIELASRLVEITQKFRLTRAELCKILGRRIQYLGDTMVRVERHPQDVRKSGDLA